MAFRFEWEMTKPVANWLRRLGFVAKTEFITPWGICDVVGAMLNLHHVRKRVNLRQCAALGSATRVALFLDIPDVDSGASISRGQLIEAYCAMLGAARIHEELDWLIERRFLLSHDRGHLQRMNGWIPLQKMLVAVELKLTRVSEAFEQARNHTQFADKSYVGFPLELAQCVAQGRARQRFRDAGIGIIGVRPRSCEIILGARFQRDRVDALAQTYSVEKFWRTRIKDRIS